MATTIRTYCYDGLESLILSKWKIKVGSQLFLNSVILSYKQTDEKNIDAKDPLLKYKSNLGGTVLQLLVSEGDTIMPGKELLKIQPCTHPVIMKDLCAECGTDLRQLDQEKFQRLTAATSFSMVHVVPELKVNLEQAEELGKDDEARLLENRKLVLLVDLDQTLIHTTNDNIPQDLPDVHHFQLYGPHSPWYHTKLRPGTNAFLEKVSQFYELHICTFGARLYAHKIAKILDPNGKYFSHRILSRDECFDPTSKMGNLKALFPRGDHMVCIIDDREDVWNYAPNVIHVKPYSYFRNTGDINAPPQSPPASDVSEVTKDPIQDDLSIKENGEENTDTASDESMKETSEASDISEQKPPDSESSPIHNKPNQNEKKTADKNTMNESSTENSTEEKIEEDAVEDSKIKETEKQEVKDVDKIETKNSDNKEPDNKKLETNSGLAVCNDDYLLYLEEILINVHKAYYKLYNKMKQKQRRSIPDLRLVVPSLRSKVLKSTNVIFSSIIPTNCVPEKHHLWTLAESLGAKVSRELVLDSSSERTTHVVASKWGTAKVNSAKRQGNIHLVLLDWLLCCAERWEHADERLFHLPKDPFLEGDNSEQSVHSPSGKPPRCTKRPRSRSGKPSKEHPMPDEETFSERVFVEAGLSLSQDDIDDMDREIYEACSGDSDQESPNSSSDSSSVESLSSGDYPKGWKKRRKHDVLNEGQELDIGGASSSDADTIGSVDEELADAVKKEFEDL